MLPAAHELSSLVGLKRLECPARSPIAPMETLVSTERRAQTQLSGYVPHCQRRMPIWLIPADQVSCGCADQFILRGHEYDGIWPQVQRASGTGRINLQIGAGSCESSVALWVC